MVTLCLSYCVLFHLVHKNDDFSERGTSPPPPQHVPSPPLPTKKLSTVHLCLKNKTQLLVTVITSYMLKPPPVIVPNKINTTALFFHFLLF